MREEDIHQDLISIRSVMERSSKFISLSGLSGILAGSYALTGSAIAYWIIQKPSSPYFLEKLGDLIDKAESLIILALVIFIASVTTGLFLTYRKAKKNGQNLWGKTSRSLLFSLCVPLITGAIFLVMIINTNGNNLIFIMPAMLIFYGLALFNASKFTFGNVKYLGLAEIILGLIAAMFTDFGLLFWTIGFGIFHIIYGSIMYLKDRENTI